MVFGKTLILRALQMCNPNTYADLAHEKIGSTIKHTAKLGLFLFIVMALMFIPAVLFQIDTFQEKISSFSTATIEGNFSTTEKTTLMQKPTIVFNNDATSAKGAQIVLTSEDVYYKPFYWFGEEKINYKDMNNLSQLDPRIVTIMIAILWPAIVFWSAVFILLKTALLVLVIASVGYLAIRLCKQTITYRKSFQAAIYAATPALLFDMLLFPIYRNGLISFAIHVIIYSLGAFILSERTLDNKKNKKNKRADYKRKTE